MPHHRAAQGPGMSPNFPRQNHTRPRSRYGCRNCKLRKLKCDESKPQCKRCLAFGVICNFMSNSNVPDLQPVVLVAVQEDAQPQPQRPLTNAVWTSDASASSASYRFQLNARCQDFITRYLGRSLITPHDPNMAQVNRQLLKLAFTHPFLMHASLAVSLTYDRHQNASHAESRRTLEECHHWSQATTLLNKRLQQPIEEKDKDPIWGTAAALVILTFSSPNACTPERAWPLRFSNSLSRANSRSNAHDGDGDGDGDGRELDWLRMTESKMALWHLMNPLRPDSLFRVMANTYAQMAVPLPETGIDGIRSSLATVCNLDDSSTAATSPYFHAAHAVSLTLDLPDSELGTGHTQLFMQSIQGRFKNLLLSRDPVALLLLYLWYCKTGRCLWWIELRARVECPSIVLYLRLYHGDCSGIHAFLPGGELNGMCDV
ncbi:hypothetical protein BJX70DRAFT_358700 [Aspergillus crustosus]